MSLACVEVTSFADRVGRKSRGPQKVEPAAKEEVMKAKKARKGEKKILDLAVSGVGKKKERGIRGGEVKHSEFKIIKLVDKSSP